ncbi:MULTISPECIES: leucyl/phenylalanyl-tRNA--protein transferase [Myroides]|uniref:Leucyl/phenylalanyl-tRNA--protein transferase n=1 Tax=Myroides albus TaxID=2562892 RepID=A0A6I3LMB9_9FLAO|nr:MULTISPECIES: leucyl/phenylalanyl-tRNA--protein transferase [Myroides]MTG98470.1 leucyl/phenylalanyl-tRNA--protein transferase [Myroides albus]MVX34443.1 leucyl/phenylalanyl-tRNA--protein transferase [Myroides sp. LoEW2-1]UVD78227.1 leucyl/phenylalanyl-tRNA--protein transferase [Myroides albus]
MITLLNEHYLSFPDVDQAHESGILALGGDLSPERLVLAYNSGIFPWFEDGEPITWWAPNPRMVLFFDNLIISKSMRNVLNRGSFRITMNTCFREVITNCQSIKRVGQNGTWITDDMIESYCTLHEMGIAKSFEVWQDGNLVGGLYGIDLGHIFCGESMFSKVSNASKVAFIYLSQYLQSMGYKLLDCQVYNDHLSSLGAIEIPRDVFMEYLLQG